MPDINQTLLALREVDHADSKMGSKSKESEILKMAP